jgi:RNA polymerase sigma-70 factor (sigma-E family)
MATAAAFDAFVIARSPRLLRTCYLLTHDHALAEDLLQTALAKAWLAWPRLGDEPEAYVRRIVVNEFTSLWRRKWRGEVPTEHLPERARDDDISGTVDERARLVAALAHLPRRQRAVVVLRFYEDLSEEQTATLLGVSVGTVKSSASRALAAMRLDPALLEDVRQ